MTALLPEKTDSDLDELRHAVCQVCYPPSDPGPVVLTLCGTELNTAEWDMDPEQPPPPPGDMCVVCADLIEAPCSKCGNRP